MPCARAHTHTHTHTHTQTHTDTQTQAHTDTHRHTQTHLDTCELVLSHSHTVDTLKHTPTQTNKQTNTDPNARPRDPKCLVGRSDPTVKPMMPFDSPSKFMGGLHALYVKIVCLEGEVEGFVPDCPQTVWDCPQTV